MITPNGDDAIKAPRAAELAHITYRQLDYWARQGWVQPSVEPGRGRPGRRLYAPSDVVKLAALGHFGRSGGDVGRLGPALTAVSLPGDQDDYLLIACDGEVEVVEASGLRARVSAAGPVYVYDPAGLRRRLAPAREAASGERKTA